MPETKILHLSDLHFGHYSPDHIQSELIQGVEELASAHSNLILLVTGDITLHGSAVHYDEAERFFRDIFQSGRLDRRRVVICPGNHDVINESFVDFDAFSCRLRQDRAFTFVDRPARSLALDEMYFLSINTCFEGTHKYGFVDESWIRGLLETDLKTVKSASRRIAVMHHHLLNQFRLDTSAIRNAYPLLRLLDEYKFDYIFHGHQHSVQSFPIGESKMRIISSRSLNFNTPGFLNGLNLYTLKDRSIEVERYSIVRDAIGPISTYSCLERSTLLK